MIFSELILRGDLNSIFQVTSKFRIIAYLMSMTVKIEDVSNLYPRVSWDRYSLKLRDIGVSVNNQNNSQIIEIGFFDYPEATSVRQFISGAPEALVTTTIDGFVKSYNNAAEKIFDYRPHEVVGQRLSMLFEADFPGVPPVIAHPLSPLPSWRTLSAAAPIRGRKKNGELFPVGILFAQCVIDEEQTIILQIKDLTAQTRQAQRIAELEREITHLSRHSMLGELATAITHELSQPLTAITNYTAAASRCWASASPDEIANGLSLISKASDQARRAWLIMNRLRKLIQHSSAEFAEEDLRVAIEEALQLATIGAENRGISVALDMPDHPVMVVIDRVQIQILIANLIRNAVDELSVTDGERRIWISLRVNDNMWAEVTVEDTGPGIASEFFENIFDPFQTTKPQGLGVGLAVCRRIARMHGGRLSADNRPEGGAAFSFTLPVSTSESVENE